MPQIVEARRACDDRSATFIGVFSDATIRVVAGSRVTVSRFSLLGDQSVEVSGGDGPGIRIRTYGLVLDLKVTG